MIRSCGIRNRVQCLSVPNERLRPGVMTYLRWQRISFLMLGQDIVIALPCTSTHMFDESTYL